VVRFAFLDDERDIGIIKNLSDMDLFEKGCVYEIDQFGYIKELGKNNMNMMTTNKDINTIITDYLPRLLTTEKELEEDSNER